jgi:hypothetical protein
MEKEAARIARWRRLADQYRMKAAIALTPGLRLALHVLAEYADGFAERIADGAITLHEGPVKKSDV